MPERGAANLLGNLEPGVFAGAKDGLQALPRQPEEGQSAFSLRQSSAPALRKQRPNPSPEPLPHAFFQGQSGDVQGIKKEHSVRRQPFMEFIAQLDSDRTAMPKHAQ